MTGNGLWVHMDTCHVTQTCPMSRVSEESHNTCHIPALSLFRHGHNKRDVWHDSTSLSWSVKCSHRVVWPPTSGLVFGNDSICNEINHRIGLQNLLTLEYCVSLLMITKYLTTDLNYATTCGVRHIFPVSGAQTVLTFETLALCNVVQWTNVSSLWGEACDTSCNV